MKTADNLFDKHRARGTTLSDSQQTLKQLRGAQL